MGSEKSCGGSVSLVGAGSFECVRSVRAHSARISLSLIHLLGVLTRITYITHDSHPYPSFARIPLECSEILKSRFALEHRYVRFEACDPGFYWNTTADEGKLFSPGRFTSYGGVRSVRARSARVSIFSHSLQYTLCCHRCLNA